MIPSFKGYADDIFHVISSFHIYRSKFGGQSYKLGKNCWTRVVHGVTFSNSKDPWSFVGPGCHQVSSVVVVRIVEGKSRVEALLNTGVKDLLTLVFSDARGKFKM